MSAVAGGSFPRMLHSGRMPARPLISRLIPSRWEASLTVACVCLVLAIGYVDFATGAYFGWSLFYLVPVVFASWYLQPPAGLALAVLAAAAWLTAELMLHPAYSPVISCWNGLTRLAIFGGIAWLLGRLRDDHIRLGMLLDLERQLSRTDSLTGLANLRSFIEEAHGRRRADRGAVCFLVIDIDNFKRLNDVYGHGAGDAFLRAVGRIIRGAVRAADITARIGGDEFGVIVRGLSEPDIDLIGTRIIDDVKRMALQFPDADVGVSIGAAWFPQPAEDVGRMRQRADEAMYRAKAAGKNCMVHWSAELVTTTAPRLDSPLPGR